MTDRGSSIDLGYLRDQLKGWEIERDPLDDPSGIAQDFGNRLAADMRRQDLNKLRLLANSAVPWIHVRNLHDADAVDGETPIDLMPWRGDSRWWRSAYATLALLGALNLRVISYTCENDGWIFVHLTPKPGQGSKAENSVGFMLGHTDALHFPFPSEFDQIGPLPPPAPDFVVLTGIRNPDRIDTRVARLSRLLENISSRAQDQLRRPVFLFAKQDTFHTSFDALVGYPVLMQDTKYGDLIRFSSSRAQVEKEKFPEAAQALNELTTALENVREPLCVAPGDILLVNNRTALHGRDAIPEQYGGQTRWLLRTYAHRQDTPGRFKDRTKPHLLSCEP